jgi:P27 family predicted phage terminase small subunit
MTNPKKPTALKQLQGTLRPSRENPNEPQPTRGIPVAPKHLSPVGKAAFATTAQLLDEMNLCTVVDAPILELVASTYADLREAEASLKARKSLFEVAKTDRGAPVIRVFPEVAIISDLRKQYLTLLAKCGLTPADRSKVSAPPKAEDPEEFRLWLKP